MITKSQDVRLKNVQPALILGLSVLEHIYKQLSNSDMVITSVNDGQHKVGSLHYEGRAADIRIHQLDLETVKTVMKRASAVLGLDFDLVLEDPETPNAHIHIEYDPK